MKPGEFTFARKPTAGCCASHGCGSCARRFARAADVPVVLVGDIDKEHNDFPAAMKKYERALVIDEALAAKNPAKYFYADQYKNENNWKAHYYTTAPEIFEELPGITHFVAALGTTGTFIGTGRRLKKYNPKIQLISLQPDSALHGMEGWKHLETAVVPTFYDPMVADQNIEVSTEEAYEFIKAAYKHEDLLLSPSSAANLAGAIRIAEKLDEGIVVTVFPDNGDKYSEVINKIL
jgi:cysteine synthase B